MERRKSKKSNPTVESLIRYVERKLGQPDFDSFCIAPVKHGYISYVDLLQGGLTIFDIEKMNNAISYYSDLEKVIIDFNNSKPKK